MTDNANEQATQAVRDAKLRALLESILSGSGPYSTDPLTHAGNCIEAMKSRAAVALAILNGEEVHEGQD